LDNVVTFIFLFVSSVDLIFSKFSICGTMMSFLRPNDCLCRLGDPDYESDLFLFWDSYR